VKDHKCHSPEGLTFTAVNIHVVFSHRLWKQHGVWVQTFHAFWQRWRFWSPHKPVVPRLRTRSSCMFFVWCLIKTREALLSTCVRRPSASRVCPPLPNQETPCLLSLELDMGVFAAVYPHWLHRDNSDRNFTLISAYGFLPPCGPFWPVNRDKYLWERKIFWTEILRKYYTFHGGYLFP
jgi:hypothetical protein